MIIQSATRRAPVGHTWVKHAVMPKALPGYVTLNSIHNRLWVEYGDWNNNLGPCDIISVGTDGDVTTHYSDLRTDRVEYREVFGAVWAVFIDPMLTGTGFIATNQSGAWEVIEVMDMSHVFDLVGTPDGDLWATGANAVIDGAEGVVYRSSDGGATWTDAVWNPSDDIRDGFLYDGCFGTILDMVPKITRDGGATWEDAGLPFSPKIVGSDWAIGTLFSDPLPVHGTPPDDLLRWLNWDIERPANVPSTQVLTRLDDGFAYCIDSPPGEPHTIWRRPAPPRDSNSDWGYRT